MESARTARATGILVSLAIVAAVFAFPSVANASDPSFSIFAHSAVIFVGGSTRITANVTGGTPNCDYSVMIRVTGPNVSSSVTIHLYTLKSGQGHVTVSYPGFFPGGSTSNPGTYSLAATFTCGSYGYGYGTGSATGSFQVRPRPHAPLTVKTFDISGNQILGYYTVLSANGTILQTGFSPITFSLDTNTPYVVQVQDYGFFVFDHWNDTGSTDRNRNVSIVSSTEIDAIYRQIQTVTLKVISLDQNNNPIFGYKVDLYQAGNLLSTGLTTFAHTVIASQPYSVVVDSGSNGCTFVRWADTGSSNPSRTVSITGYTTFAAVYECVTSTLVVVTEHANDGPLTGYYTTISQNGTVLPESCSFSTCAFPVDNGQTYQVTVSNFGGEVFDHWSDNMGITYPWGGSRAVTVAGGGTTITITVVALYNP